MLGMGGSTELPDLSSEPRFCEKWLRKIQTYIEYTIKG